MTFYVRMAWRSLRRSRGLSTVMIVALSLGLGCWYSQRQILAYLESKVPPTRAGLYHVGLDRDVPTTPTREVLLMLPSLVLTPQDAIRVAELAAPARATITFGASGLAEVDGAPAVATRVRYASRELFSMFQVPLVAGAPWSAGATNEVVLNAELARRIFGTSDAVGRDVRIDGVRMRVAGIVAASYPSSYVLYERFIDAPATVYVPLAHAAASQAAADFQHPVAGGESGTVQLWLELDNPATVAALASRVSAYLAGERARGRLASPTRMRLRSSHAWSQMYRPAGTIGLWPLLAGMCIVTCVINLTRMLSAKFADRRHDLGLLRAFGARRGVVLGQLLIEATLVGIIAGIGGLLFGLILMPLSIATINDALGTPEVISLESVLTIFTLSIGAALVAALLPAWVLSRGTPALQLRSS